MLHRHNVQGQRLYRPAQLIVRPVLPDPPVAAEPAPMPWDHFTTHAQMGEWVQHWQDDHDLVLPDGWDGWTLAQKRDWLNANVDPTP